MDLNSDTETYCRIRTETLISVAPLRGDIYIRLSETKFVKMFREGDVFDREDLRRYSVEKKLDYVYIRRDQLPEFLAKFSAEVQKPLLAKAELTIEKAVEIGDEIFDAVQEAANQVGFTRDVQDLVKTHTKLAMKAMGEEPTLKDILARIDSFKHGYIGKHSMLTGYVACALASHLEWGSESTFQKLSIAAFIHDVHLNSNELAECLTVAQVRESKKFKDEEIAAFIVHPVKAGEAAKLFKEVPPDIDTIILQHHEKPDGSGFPKGLTHAYISPLSAIFIIAHDLSRFALLGGEILRSREYIENAARVYNHGHFKKVLEALEKLQISETV